MSTISPPLTTSITVPLTVPPGLGDFLDLAPGSLVLGTLLGENETAFVVLFVEDEGFDLVAHRDDGGGIDVGPDREFFGRDQTL